MNLTRIDQQKPKSLEPRMRKRIAQCCAVSGPDLLMMILGASNGFLTILLSELYRKDAEIVVTTDELTWISSIRWLASPLGSVVAGPFIDGIGRKPMMLVAAVAYLLSWVLLYLWATKAWTLMLTFAIIGFASGVADSSTHPYVSEVTEFRYRGIVLASVSLGINLGNFLQFLTGNYFHWRICALINATATAVAMIVIFFVPESPQWLAKHGRLTETNRSLRWLRGWTDSGSVKLEYDSLTELFSDAAKQSSPSCGSTVKSLFRREVLLPFFTMAFIFFIRNCNGVNALLTYVVLIFGKIESPINEYHAMILTGALQLLAMSIQIVAISRIGKRLPTIGSLVVSALAFLGIAVYVYLREQNIIHKDSGHLWIPMTLVLLTIFVSFGGIQSTPWILASELFPVKVKGVSLSILSSVSSMFNAVANKSFLYMLDGLTLPGTFAFFAAISLLGCIVLYRVMPETEGKSLAEIEKIYQKKSRGYLPNN